MPVLQRAATQVAPDPSSLVDNSSHKRVRANSLPACINELEISDVIPTKTATESACSELLQGTISGDDEETVRVTQDKWKFAKMVPESQSASISLNFSRNKLKQDLSATKVPPKSSPAENTMKRKAGQDLDGNPNKDGSKLDDQASQPVVSDGQCKGRGVAKKRLKPIPINAPRSIETKGRFTFRQGVRIYDYQVPRYGGGRLIQSKRAFQCRDSFDDTELPPGMPSVLAKPQELPKVWTFGSFPLNNTTYYEGATPAPTSLPIPTPASMSLQFKNQDQGDEEAGVDAFGDWIKM